MRRRSLVARGLEEHAHRREAPQHVSETKHEITVDCGDLTANCRKKSPRYSERNADGKKTAHTNHETRAIDISAPPTSSLS